jgi:hypothetical protein
MLRKCNSAITRKRQQMQPKYTVNIQPKKIQRAAEIGKRVDIKIAA